MGQIRSVLRWRIGFARHVRNRGKAFFVTIATKIGDEWTKWAPFSVYISDQAIDSHLVYRLIEPGYEKWHIVGIYQRNLESFDEQPIIRNDMTGYNCMNCHSFCMGDPGQMMFHMRAANGGTYIVQDKKNQINWIRKRMGRSVIWRILSGILPGAISPHR